MPARRASAGLQARQGGVRPRSMSGGACPSEVLIALQVLMDWRWRKNESCNLSSSARCVIAADQPETQRFVHVTQARGGRRPVRSPFCRTPTRRCPCGFVMPRQTHRRGQSGPAERKNLGGLELERPQFLLETSASKCRRRLLALMISHSSRPAVSNRCGTALEK